MCFFFFYSAFSPRTVSENLFGGNRVKKKLFETINPARMAYQHRQLVHVKSRNSSRWKPSRPNPSAVNKFVKFENYAIIGKGNKLRLLRIFEHDRGATLCNNGDAVMSFQRFPENDNENRRRKENEYYKTQAQAFTQK